MRETRPAAARAARNRRVDRSECEIADTPLRRDRIVGFCESELFSRRAGDETRNAPAPTGARAPPGTAAGNRIGRASIAQDLTVDGFFDVP